MLFVALGCWKVYMKGEQLMGHHLKCVPVPTLKPLQLLPYNVFPRSHLLRPFL